MGHPVRSNKMPLQPQVMIDPSEKWALDFIGMIFLASKNKRYILVCTDYVTKRVDAKVIFHATERTIVDFLFEDIFTHFDVPREILTYQGMQFTSKLVHAITEQYQIKHHRSSPYHPQANG